MKTCDKRQPSYGRTTIPHNMLGKIVVRTTGRLSQQIAGVAATTNSTDDTETWSIELVDATGFHALTRLLQSGLVTAIEMTIHNMQAADRLCACLKQNCATLNGLSIIVKNSLAFMDANLCGILRRNPKRHKPLNVRSVRFCHISDASAALIQDHSPFLEEVAFGYHAVAPRWFAHPIRSRLFKINLAPENCGLHVKKFNAEGAVKKQIATLMYALECSRNCAIWGLPKVLLPLLAKFLL